MIQPEQIFTDEVLRSLFPPERTDAFFDALFGDAAEGAYDIALTYTGYDPQGHTLDFLLNLHERPGRCLACNLTYGLPEVFSRHPVINIKGLVGEIEQQLGGSLTCTGWKLGHTEQKGRSLHCIPLRMQLAAK
ncbi:pancreas/duodenum homeobox protein 1 [Desulfobulbus elongatus]|uniref:pancreas/duodenum homeobox protein 1 n=1 Tax=Desulfobulbus elongatus TaxID=53332 RepID=UPI000B157E36|nr:pancreas/duodenum homeobox protein 1 [Desulfobulbus elongatus]